MIGEHDVEKLGSEPLKSSLRHTTLPVAASRQDRVPRAPSVTTLPSATAGELLGPENSLARPAAIPVTAGASCLSCQSSFPSAAPRQRRTSFPSWWEKTYSLSPTRAGVATPSPTGTFHFWVSSLGQSFGAVNPAARASRLGPRHWGQSWAHAQLAPSSSTQPAAPAVVHIAIFMAAPVWF